MISRELPFDAELKALAAQRDQYTASGDETRAVEAANALAQKSHAAVVELLRQPGWQLVVGMMREVVDAALSSIADGQRPEFHAGAISAVEHLKRRLREQTTTPEIIEVHDEGLVFSYE
jgi:hypothetical protein